VPFVVVVVVLAKSLILYINTGSCARNLGPVQTYPLFLKNDFLKDWPFVHKLRWFFIELANSEYDLISTGAYFTTERRSSKSTRQKVSTMRGQTSEALTLTCVAGAGLFLGRRKNNNKKNNRPAPATQVTLTNTSTFSSLNICFRGREGAFTDESRSF